MPDETFVPGADRSSTWGLLDVQVDGNDVEETLRKPGAKHFRLRSSLSPPRRMSLNRLAEFEEGSTNFFCKIFFAEQFDALRQNCGCGTQFIESLARCVKWESSGGRSKVDFLKTRGASICLNLSQRILTRNVDDRFIVKEISRLEMDALLRFAPAYFEYMSKAFFHGVLLFCLLPLTPLTCGRSTAPHHPRQDLWILSNWIAQPCDRQGDASRYPRDGGESCRVLPRPITDNLPSAESILRASTFSSQSRLITSSSTLTYVYPGL